MAAEEVALRMRGVQVINTREEKGACIPPSSLGGSSGGLYPTFPRHKVAMNTDSGNLNYRGAGRS